jgi:hypothetical protein
MRPCGSVPVVTVTVVLFCGRLMPVTFGTVFDDGKANGRLFDNPKFSHFEICIPYSKSVSTRAWACEVRSFPAESKYSFQYSGLIDSDITYNPYKDSTLVVRGDYFGAESVDEAIYGSFYPRIAIDDDGLNNIIGNLMARGVVTLDGETLGTNYTRSQFEELYTNKAKKDLFKKSATILLHKSEKGNLNIVLAYKDTSQDIPQYIPVGLMNTLEQSIYAYTTENDDKKPRATRNIMMSNFIRNEIESLASSVDLSSGKLVEIDYDRVKFTGARTTGLNITRDYEAVSERINSKTQRPTVYVINKKEIIAQKNLTNEENDILNEYNTDAYEDKFRVFYKTSDKLGKTVILPATLKKYNDAPKEYKEGLKNKITELIELAESSSIVEGVYLNESKLKEVIDEILNNYTNFTYNTPTDFVNSIKGYDDFINKYNINDKNMVKVEVATAQGKQLHDKREDMKAKTMHRETQQILKSMK